jgi:hypothetical protein
MKLNELLQDFTIFLNNEEKNFLDKFSRGCYIDTLTEHDQLIVDNLIRKSVLVKVRHQGSYWVYIDENFKPSS